MVRRDSPYHPSVLMAAATGGGRWCRTTPLTHAAAPFPRGTTWRTPPRTALHALLPARHSRLLLPSLSPRTCRHLFAPAHSYGLCRSNCVAPFLIPNALRHLARRANAFSLALGIWTTAAANLAHTAARWRGDALPAGATACACMLPPLPPRAALQPAVPCSAEHLAHDDIAFTVRLAFSLCRAPDENLQVLTTTRSCQRALLLTAFVSMFTQLCRWLSLR